MVILIWLEARLPGAVGEVGALWLIGLVATIVLARGKEKWQNGERWWQRGTGSWQSGAGSWQSGAGWWEAVTPYLIIFFIIATIFELAPVTEKVVLMGSCLLTLVFIYCAGAHVDCNGGVDEG